MSVDAEKVLESALTLSLSERAEIADRLLESLQPLNPDYEALWAKEAESRIAAFEAGKMPAYSAEEVFAELARE